MIIPNDYYVGMKYLSDALRDLGYSEASKRIGLITNLETKKQAEDALVLLQQLCCVVENDYKKSTDNFDKKCLNMLLNTIEFAGSTTASFVLGWEVKPKIDKNLN